MAREGAIGRLRLLGAIADCAGLLAAVASLLLCLLPTTELAAQGPALSTSSNPPANESKPSVEGTLPEILERRGDLTLRNMSLSGALYTISEQWGINIVSGAISGEVNGVFKNAPLREILDSILLSNGYSYRQVGESLVVSPLDELGQVNPFFKTATIPVRYADVNEVVAGAQLLSTPQGQIHALPSAQSILVVDFPKQVDMIREFVGGIDEATHRLRDPRAASLKLRPLEVGYFRTQFVSSDAAKKALEAIISKEGRIAEVEQEDRLVVVDYSENLAMARAVLSRVDRPRPQVRIKALIYDLSLQDVEQLGINWNSEVKDRLDADGEAQSLFSIDSVLQVPFQDGATGGTLTFMSLSDYFDLDAVVLALQNAADSRLLADPNVVVMENEEAIFQSVSEIPYQQLTQTEAGGQIGTTAFKEAGITLRVLPKIAADGTVEMRVSPEFSTLTGFTPGDNQPIIDKRVTTTTLRIANRQTVVIGGLRQRTDVGDFNGLPYLKDMKWVGKLFRARETDIKESELVVFLTPEIVGYRDPPNMRQHLVADTIGCRLDRIPQAQNCPWTYGNPDGVEFVEPGPTAGADDSDVRASNTNSVLHDSEVKGTTKQRRGPAAFDPIPDPADPPSTSFDSQPPIQFDLTSFAPGSQVMGTEDQLHQIPPMEYVQTSDGSVQAGVPVQDRNNDVAVLKNRLRPDYDARFRATGGVYAGQQRTAERETGRTAKKDTDAKKKRTIWDKLFWR